LLAPVVIQTGFGRNTAPGGLETPYPGAGYT